MNAGNEWIGEEDGRGTKGTPVGAKSTGVASAAAIPFETGAGEGRADDAGVESVTDAVPLDKDEVVDEQVAIGGRGIQLELRASSGPLWVPNAASKLL